MSNLENLVKALVRLFKTKSRVFEFDHQYMNTLEFFQCSKNDVLDRSMFDKMVSDPSLKIFQIAKFGEHCKSKV